MLNQLPFLLSKLVELGHRVLPTLRPQAWFFLALPLAVCLSLIVGVGPNLQHSIFSTISSSAPTLYEAAYPDGMGTWPSLADWMIYAFDPIFLTIAGLTTLIALRGETFRAVVVSTAISIAGLYTVADLIGGLFIKNYAITQQLVNVAANILGGILAALIVAAALAIYKFIIRNVQGDRLSKSIAAICLVALGGLTSMTAYYALGFLYNPSRAEISVLLDAPVDGDLGFSWQGADPSGSDAEERQNYFDFLPTLSNSGSISVENFRSAIAANWNLSERSRGYRVELRLLTDCTYARLSDFPTTQALFSRTGVRRVSVESDVGGSMLRASTEGSRDFRWHPVRPNTYSIDRSSEDETLRVSHSGRAEDRLEMASSSQVDIALASIFYGRQGDRFASAPRILTFSVDDERYTIRFEPAVAERDRPRCGALAPGQIVRRGNSWTVRDAGYLAGTAVITLLPQSDDPPFFSKRESNVVISGGAGWFSVQDLANADLRGHRGDITLLSARGNVSEFSVDGNPVDVKPYHQVFLTGQLSAAYLSDGKIRVSGSALSARLDRRRLNLTRWEALRSEWQLALLGATISALIALGAWAWRVLVRFDTDDVRKWVA